MKKLIVILALSLGAFSTPAKATPGIDSWVPYYADAAALYGFYFGWFGDFGSFDDEYADALRSISFEDLMNAQVFGEVVSPGYTATGSTETTLTAVGINDGIDLCVSPD